VLHGDLHHGNVLDFGLRGWLAIDPKGLLGERGFDFANIFTNPISPIRGAASRVAWRSWSRRRGLSESACCVGFLPGLGCRRRGSSATAIQSR
jgi:aminoglycoside/hydroxyurea antibiotic resistance kinase